MKSQLNAAAVLVVLLAAGTAQAATTYTVDPNHSDVSFQIRHLFSKVRGSFRDFSGKIVKDEANPAASSVEFKIVVASIDTGNETRDKDLRSEQFFWVEKHPELTFESSAVEKVSDNFYKVTGSLTLHGVTKVVALSVTFEGEANDPWGNVVAAFSTSTRLDRKEFGMTWNRTLDNGSFLLSDEVDVSIALEAKAAK